MIMDMYEKINSFYHKKTFNKEWALECGNGNKKLDEIQIFVQFLQNKNEIISSVDSFNEDFLYKEVDVAEPGDLAYLGQKYQITHGKIKNYFASQKAKNDDLKKQKNGSLPQAFIISAPDYPLDDDRRLEAYFSDLLKKESTAQNDIILLVRIDRRDKPKSNLKIDTGWKDVIFIFDDENLSVKK